MPESREPLAVASLRLGAELARVPRKCRVESNSDPAHARDRDDLLCCLGSKLTDNGAFWSRERDGDINAAGCVDAYGAHKPKVNDGDSDFRVDYTTEGCHHCRRVGRGSSCGHIGRIGECGSGVQA